MSNRWDPAFYKSGYEGFEAGARFSDDDSLLAYRRMILSKTGEQSAFIVEKCGTPLRVLEIASGNGRLLVDLALRGYLSEGVGIEISRSRTQFAERWARDCGLSQIRFVDGDALDCGGIPGCVDLAVCLTGAFHYFRAIRTSAPVDLLNRMRESLRPDGVVLLELYNLPAARRDLLTIAGGLLREWRPLPDDDPFAYYLDEYRYWADDRILRYDKVFIGRDGSIDKGRSEVLGYYDTVEITALLESAGFSEVRHFGGFDGRPHCEGDTVHVIMARRNR